MTTPTDKQERTPQEIGRAIADKLSTGDNDSVRALAKEAFCPASDDEFDDMWNDGDFRRFCCLPVKLARESAAPSGGCDVCGAEPGRCMTSTICAQERETRRENARAAASSDINEHLKGDDPRLEPCGGTRGANTPQDSSGPHTAAAAQSSNECGEIAGYVEASALKDIQPGWDNAVPLTKDCEHSGMIPLFRAVESASSSTALTHTDHPLRHFDRTCPACVAESASREPLNAIYQKTFDQKPAHIILREIQELAMAGLAPLPEAEGPK